MNQLPGDTGFEISVCICTYRRPALLAKLLDALAAQASLSLPFETVVVDNDRQRSAEATVEARRSAPGMHLRYLVEPEQNIARARNCAVRAANGRWLAMIDDDECPSPNWLRHLHETARAYKPSMVLGPVLASLPSGTAQWLHDGGFFERPRHPTGTEVPYMQVRTSNLLLSREAAHAVAGPFDPRYGLSGGEDIMLLETLRSLGHRPVWCDQASVVETVPRERANLRYILSRAYGSAQSYAHVHRSLARDHAERLRRTATLCLRSLAALPASLLLSAVWCPLDRARSAHWLQLAAMQCGKLSALIGRSHQRYVATVNDSEPEPTATSQVAEQSNGHSGDDPTRVYR